MSKKILIFGTFNPITNAHLDMGVRAKSVYPDATVVYVPAKTDFLKGWKQFDSGKILKEDIRMKLIREATEKMGFQVSEIEITGEVDGKTYNTIKYFRDHGDDVILCMGSDKPGELNRWYRGEDIVRENRFVILTRDHKKGEFPEELRRYSDHITYVEGHYQSISSTGIRDAYINGDLDSVREDIPECVYHYLKSVEDAYV